MENSPVFKTVYSIVVATVNRKAFHLVSFFCIFTIIKNLEKGT